MTDRRMRTWVRLLCAVALGLGLSAAAGGVASASSPPRPVGVHVQGAVADLVAAGHSPESVRHVLHRPGTAAVTAGVIVGAGLAAGLTLTAVFRRRSTSSAGRRSHTAGARAPPVAIGC